MAFSRKPPFQTDSDPGLKDELSSFANGVKSYVGARSELLSIEAKEAATILGRKAGLGGLAIFFLHAGYLLLLASGVGILGQLLDPEQSLKLRGWVGASLLLAAVHLAGGFLILLRQKRTGRNIELFEVTRAEFRKDQEWLNNENGN